MPKQYVLCGRLLPPITTRRITMLLSAVIVFAVFSVVLTLPSGVPTGPSLSRFADHASSLNPFRAKSHTPPVDSDSHKGSSWSVHWSWLTTPFSSSYTLDEDRALLPPLPPRPPIYCYYDSTLDRDKAVRDAESTLLLTWRRAWWAQGFRPIILGAAEATTNPRYAELQARSEQVPAAAKTDLLRWLAWETMGGGLLAQYRVLPMGEPDDPLLTFLRRGEYPLLTRWDTLGDGLFAGSKEDVAAAIKLVLESPALVHAESFLAAAEVVAAPAAAAAAPAAAAAAPAAAVPVVAAPAVGAAAAVPVAAAPAAAHAARAADEPPKAAAAAVAAAAPTEDDYRKPTKGYPFKVDTAPPSLAYYSPEVVASKYGKVQDALKESMAVGLQKLDQLINAHLHLTWQNAFPKGIAVLKPKPHYMTTMIQPAVELAQRLAQCSASPQEASCPPSLSQCNPCVAKSPMPVHTPPIYRNTSTVFTIGTVPHPYTFQSVVYKQGAVDVRWLRRKSPRDAWLFEVTRELLGTGVSSAARVLRFKEAVAGDYGRAHTLWLPTEQPVPGDLDFRFGFVVPPLGGGLDKGESATPVPGPERLPPPQHDKKDGPVANPERLVQEQELLIKARAMEASQNARDRSIRDAVEAWNMGDMEACKFVRAFLARGDAERAAWEKEESKYAGGAGSAKRRDGQWF